jgi:signal transduction histidine kinase
MLFRIRRRLTLVLCLVVASPVLALAGSNFMLVCDFAQNRCPSGAAPEIWTLSEQAASRVATKMGLTFAVSMAFSVVVAAWLSKRLMAVAAQLWGGLSALRPALSPGLEPRSVAELEDGLLMQLHRLAANGAESTRDERLEQARAAVRALSLEVSEAVAPVRTASWTVRSALDARSRADGELSRAATLVGDRVAALEALANRFGALARLSTPARSRVPLRYATEHAVRTLDDMAAERRICVSLNAENVQAEVDQEQFERVVVNLVKNAMEASPNGSTVKIRLFQEGVSAVIEVEDCGSGLTAEAQANLFRPAPSTKAGAAGVGLAVLHHIVTGHGGWVSVTPGRLGSLFRVTLPLRAPDGGLSLPPGTSRA